MDIYIFGYGSLIYAEGINGRRMKRIYADNDLIEARLKDYERRWNTVYCNIRYLGVVQKKGAITNGVIFPISREDMKPFLISEVSYSPPASYNIEDVSRLIESEAEFDRNDVVLTCVTANPSSRGRIASYYINCIKNGLRVRGKEFADEFMGTTFPADILKEVI